MSIDQRIGDTIFAPATAPGPAGIAVIRVSGPRARQVLEAVGGIDAAPPRRAIRCRMVDPETGEALDDGLALWFPGPASFTGEDVAELHVHGGRATVEGICTVLGRMEGLRFAEAGEFSRRAFHNGKLDLTEIEGLADLIAAETEAQRRQALRQLEGALGRMLEDWRARLLAALARIEAAIDFPDEDLPDRLVSETNHQILGLCGEISQFLDDNHRGERVRDGLSLAIVGAPNVGKSSLLNALARRDAAIVSETAGTTRDIVEVRLDLAGYPATLADTAGLREAADAIEEEGVRRALARADAADLKLVVFDASSGTPDAASLAQLGPDSVAIVNKADLGTMALLDDLRSDLPGAIAVSVRTGENLDALLAEIERRVADRLDRGGGTRSAAPRRI